MLAGKLFKIPVKGTHAHAYVTSFTGIEDLQTRTLKRCPVKAENDEGVDEEQNGLEEHGEMEDD